MHGVRAATGERRRPPGSSGLRISLGTGSVASGGLGLRFRVQEVSSRLGFRVRLSIR